MARWKPDARGRLQHAALTLYGEQGFDRTTVAEVAERAGLTKRTFFRYFADKREVLFHGSQALEALFVAEVRGAPESEAPLEAIAVALDAAAAMFEERREFALQRQQVIDASPELQERERIKLASLAAAAASALRDRGVDEPAATLAAETGVTVLRVSFERWTDPANQDSLPRLIHATLRELRSLIAA